MTKKIQHRFYAVTLPSDFTLDQMLDFLDSLSTGLSRGHHVVLELWADKYGIKHRVGIPWQHTELLSQLRTHITGIHIVEDKRPGIPEWKHVVEVGVSNNLLPFNLQRVEAQVRRLLGAAIADQKADDITLIQLVVRPGQRIKGPSQSREVSSSNWALDALWKGTRADPDEVASRRANAAQNQFRAVLRIASFSDTNAHAKKLIDNIRRAYKVPETADIHFTDRWYIPKQSRIERINRAVRPGFPFEFINATEVAAFAAWPIGSPMIAGLTIGKTRYLPPNETISKIGRRLGLSYQDRPIAISPEDTCRHMYVLGPSGYGKTTLLANGLQQDIERGDGAVVIESKGDLYRAALNAVPKERIADAVVMDLTDQEWPVGLNILHGGNINRRVDELTRLFARGDADIYFRDLMYHGLHTLSRFPELTIVDLVPFLWPQDAMTKAWRDNLINRLPKNDVLYHYWKTFISLKDSEKKQRVQPVLNRLWEVTNRPDIRNILGQSESTIDLRQIMSENKLLFVYIPDSIGEQTVSLLTSLLFKELWDAVRDVVDVKTRPTHLYLDEAQRLSGYTNLAETLSLARSFKYGLNLANQYKSQLGPDVQAAITNASTLAAFKLDGPDAKWIADIMGKAITPDDFMNLGPHEVIARLAINGGSSSPTWFKTLPQFDPHGQAREVVESSRSQFSRSAKKVNELILQRRSAPIEPTRAKPSFGIVDKADSS